MGEQGEEPYEEAALVQRRKREPFSLTAVEPTMSPESENPPSSDSRQTRPLWIIAISLAAIAVCLILITIRIQLNRWNAAAANEANVAPIEVSIEQPDRRPVQRHTFKRSEPQIPGPETVPPAAPASVPVTNVASASPLNFPAHGGLAAASAPRSTNAPGGIAGRVILTGEPPVEPSIEETARPPCLDHSGNVLSNPMFKVGSDGGLAEVIVMIAAGLDVGRVAPPPMTNHLWTFTNCQIYPFISVVRQGQRFGFTGASDPPHLIHLARTLSLNPRMRNPFRVGSPLHTSGLAQSTNDLFQLKCEEHPWEVAYFAGCSHHFFAITDTNGNFTIPRVPAGNYTLQALHRGWVGTNEIKQVISVQNGETSTVNFLIDSPEMKMSTQTLSAQR